MTTPQPERVDVYVRTRNVMREGLCSEEVADDVTIDYWTDSHGREHVAGVKVLWARGVEVDGVDVRTGRPHGAAPSADGMGATTPADLCHSALAELVALKDGPRDDHYRECKEQAWATARAALASSAIGESSSLPEPLHEVSCPQCGATIRARIADAPDEATACCDELNPDTGYRCRRAPVHDAGKSIRKHVQIDKLGQVDWWITPARALLSGGEQQ